MQSGNINYVKIIRNSICPVGQALPTNVSIVSTDRTQTISKKHFVSTQKHEN